MKQLFSNNYYKVMEVALNGGEAMPLHQATSDAFIIVKDGSGKIIFSDNEIELHQGSTQLIPANTQHRLQVHDAFKACIILASEAAIKFL
ncbi:MAG: cupin domain-containing protein [Bacteroidota bacterium]|nr:cupin domain-containing protein [Bacteroidota bacterium]